ncbi:XRE family transcriptional regulator [Pedobacter sp. G11]|uniref:helix-turn-helix domain-containing protein n=1 Tax=Pedobacter sp. G11 TaxID=2482728 RepID=UPI000F5F3FA4|nr:helix-turn-helix transcriptional regulator [Pedobacter sp. G11]AZI26774.1 XRE family transcriptional regulator [Pedobacter sp. G11]
MSITMSNGVYPGVISNKEIGEVVTAPRNHRHGGNIIETIIRRRGHNISKLAKYMNISRCTIYHWFQKESLPSDVLFKIGTFINHDFSEEFPELFHMKVESNVNKSFKNCHPDESKDVDHWILKYILLLEKYNETLSKRVK